jgi:hypothetical protein
VVGLPVSICKVGSISGNSSAVQDVKKAIKSKDTSKKNTFFIIVNIKD